MCLCVRVRACVVAAFVCLFVGVCAFDCVCACLGLPCHVVFCFVLFCVFKCVRAGVCVRVCGALLCLLIV